MLQYILQLESNSKRNFFLFLQHTWKVVSKLFQSNNDFWVKQNTLPVRGIQIDPLNYLLNVIKYVGV